MATTTADVVVNPFGPAGTAALNASSAGSNESSGDVLSMNPFSNPNIEGDKAAPAIRRRRIPRRSAVSRTAMAVVAGVLNKPCHSSALILISVATVATFLSLVCPWLDFTTGKISVAGLGPVVRYGSSTTSQMWTCEDVQNGASVVDIYTPVKACNIFWLNDGPFVLLFLRTAGMLCLALMLIATVFGALGSYLTHLRRAEKHLSLPFWLAWLVHWITVVVFHALTCICALIAIAFWVSEISANSINDTYIALLGTTFGEKSVTLGAGFAMAVVAFVCAFVSTVIMAVVRNEPSRLAHLSAWSAAAAAARSPSSAAVATAAAAGAEGPGGAGGSAPCSIVNTVVAAATEASISAPVIVVAKPQVRQSLLWRLGGSSGRVARASIIATHPPPTAVPPPPPPPPVAVKAPAPPSRPLPALSPIREASSSARGGPDAETLPMNLEGAGGGVGAGFSPFKDGALSPPPARRWPPMSAATAAATPEESPAPGGGRLHI